MINHSLSRTLLKSLLMLLVAYPFLVYGGDSTEPSLENETTIYCNWQYINFFNVKDDNGVERYLNYTRQHYQGTYSINDYVLGISYQNNKLNGFANNLDNLPDRFNYRYQNRQIGLQLSGKKIYGGFLEANFLYNNYFGGGLEYTNKNYKAGINVKPYVTFLKYNVSGFSGRIPLSAYSADFSAGYKQFNAVYRRLFPLYPDQDFQNNLYGDIFSVSFKNTGMKPVTFESHISYGNIRGEMHYTNNQYGYLDHFQFLNYLVKLDWPINKNHILFIENRAAYTWIESESYLEIWPFSYWSQLLASRTKLTASEVKLNLPGIGYRHHFLYQKNKFQISNNFITSYSQFLFSNNLMTADRYFVVYPVLIDYQPNSYSADLDTDGIIRLHNHLELNYQDFHLGLNIMQLIPVNFNSSAANNTATSNEKKTGGFLISISFKFILN